MSNEGTTHTTPAGLNTSESIIPPNGSIVEPRAAVETGETDRAGERLGRSLGLQHEGQEGRTEK